MYCVPFQRQLQPLASAEHVQMIPAPSRRVPLVLPAGARGTEKQDALLACNTM